MKKLPIILSIILSSCGGGGGGGTDSNEIQNNPPSINNSNFTYDVVENQTQAFSVNASDPDNDVIVYEINGERVDDSKHKDILKLLNQFKKFK